MTFDAKNCESKTAKNRKSKSSKFHNKTSKTANLKTSKMKKIEQKAGTKRKALLKLARLCAASGAKKSLFKLALNRLNPSCDPLV